MEKTTLYLPREMQVELRDAARREGRSQAEIVREALDHYLRTSERPQPRSLGAFTQESDRGERVAARDAKAWVRDRWREQSSRGSGAGTP